MPIPDTQPISNKINDQEITTPVLWLGHDLDHQVKVWKSIDNCQGVLVNAYQLLERPRVLNKVTKYGLKQHLEFQGPIFMDSGGYLFQQSGISNINLDDLHNLYNSTKPEIAAVLDIPLNPVLTDDENELRWQKTLNNTLRMFDNNQNLILSPIIHAYRSDVIEDRCKEIKKIIPDPTIICIGSLVPLLKASYIGTRFNTQTDGVTSTMYRWRYISDLVKSVRRCFQKSIIHIYGAGSLSTMYLLFFLGADSLDSISWRLKAGFGAIQLPGLSDRFLKPVEGSIRKRQMLNSEDLKLLDECKCPICYGKSLPLRISVLEKSFYNRATHNAFVANEEVKLIGQWKRDGNFITMVSERLSGHRYRSIFDDLIGYIQ